MRSEADLRAQRERMIDEQLRTRGLDDENVLRAMAEVPREAFVPEDRRDLAYADGALSLGYGQTISQPYMVARAAQLAALDKNDAVLEVGLGCGYQAAVLSRLCARVIGLELIPELAEGAAQRLKELGFENVTVQVGDGSLGCPEHAPYDAIVVSAGAPEIPEALLAQLKPHGRLVIPVGSEQLQTLQVISREADAHTTRVYDACVYVPLRGAAGVPHTDPLLGAAGRA